VKRLGAAFIVAVLVLPLAAIAAQSRFRSGEGLRCSAARNTSATRRLISAPEVPPDRLRFRRSFASCWVDCPNKPSWGGRYGGIRNVPVSSSRRRREELLADHTDRRSPLALPEVRQRMFDLGYETVGSSPREFTEFMRADTAQFAKIISGAGIRPE
jgi:hypothetical protein